jgi:signal transduction histidine kinase
MEVTLKQKNVLHIVLKDDGEGFDVHGAKKGNGLANMHTRAGRLHGKLYIDSRKDKGTIITLSFKIPPNR